jgi:type IV secretion system protein VirD4
MLPSFSTWSLVLAFLGLTLVVGCGLTVAVGLMKAWLWLFGLSASLCTWLWAWLTGKPPSSHGTAHWADADEINAKGVFTLGSIPLGTWHGKPLYEPMGGHVALIGPPRSRKSWGLLMPAISGFEGSLVINDPRGELWSHCHTSREARGPTYKFSPTTKESCRINIMESIRWYEDEAHGDVALLSHHLLSPDVGQPWDDFRLQAKTLLTPILMHCHHQGQRSLPGVWRWLTSPSTTMKAQATELLSSPLPTVQAGGRRLKDVLTSERTASIVWNHLVSALELYSDPIVASHTESSDVALRELQHGLRPVSIFLTPPFADVSRLQPLLGAMVEMLTALFSAQQDKPRQTVGLFMDEFCNLGRLSEVERGVSYLQGAGVQLLAVLQNIEQFRSVYGPHSPLLASIGTSVYYAPGDPATADYLSGELGVTTKRLHPETQHRSFWGLLNSVSTGTSEHERPLLTSDETRRLDESAAVVIVKGLAPILGEKLGAPPQEIIDLSSSRLKRVASVAAAILVAGAMGTWALWPTPQTPAPSLSLTPLQPQRTEAPPSPEVPPPELANPWATWPGMTTRQSTPWVLYSQRTQGGITSAGMGLISGLPSGNFVTQAECQAALHAQSERQITQLRQLAAVQQGLRVQVVDRENYIAVEQRQGNGRFASPQRSESFCYLKVEADS